MSRKPAHIWSVRKLGKRYRQLRNSLPLTSSDSLTPMYVCMRKSVHVSMNIQNIYRYIKTEKKDQPAINKELENRRNWNWVNLLHHSQLFKASVKSDVVRNLIFGWSRTFNRQLCAALVALKSNVKYHTSRITPRNKFESLRKEERLNY